MHNRQKPTLSQTHAQWGARTTSHLAASVSLSACFLALGLCLHFPTPAAAQQNPIVDLTDPYVSVDLSVLSDSGLGSRAGAPGMPVPGQMQGQMPGQVSGQVLGQISATGQTVSGSQQPGLNMPVSELYVKPTSRFRLPEQTKAIETTYVQASEQEMDHEVDDATPSEMPVVAKAPTEKPKPQSAPGKTVSAPPAAPSFPDAAEIADILPPPDAEVTAPAAPVAAPPASPAEPVAEVKPAPKPIQEMAALTPPPPPKPTPAPAAAVVAESVPDAPQPTVEDSANKPLALKTPTPPVEVSKEPTESAVALKDAASEAEQAIPMPPPSAPHAEASNALIMPLPPQAEAQPTAPSDVASLPSASQTLSDGDSLRIVFDADSSKLPKSSKDALLDMSNKLSSSETLRLQLLAYAGTASTSASAARRLSLSRALAVRSFLIENGVRSTRIDVRALGNKSSDAVSERVDISVIER